MVRVLACLLVRFVSQSGNDGISTQRSVGGHGDCHKHARQCGAGSRILRQHWVPRIHADACGRIFPGLPSPDSRAIPVLFESGSISAMHQVLIRGPCVFPKKVELRVPENHDSTDAAAALAAASAGGNKRRRQDKASWCTMLKVSAEHDCMCLPRVRVGAVRVRIFAGRLVSTLRHFN